MARRESQALWSTTPQAARSLYTKRFAYYVGRRKSEYDAAQRPGQALKRLRWDPKVRGVGSQNKRGYLGTRPNG
jgi:hypothetical protein